MSGKNPKASADASGAKTSPRKQTAERQISQNRRAHYDFELGERYEAGLSLVGSEARSLRENPADLSDAWVEIKNGQPFVRGMRIPPLVHSFLGHEEKRARQLLLHRSEIEKLERAIDRERMTLVVTKAYFRHGRAKIEIAVAKGKKTHDKRQSLKARAENRDARDAVRRGKGG